MRTTSAFQPNTAAGTTKAYYPLNGNSRDFSGNTNTGTDTAITYPQGRFGQGARFLADYSSLVTLTSQVTPATTISFWCKLTETFSGASGKTILYSASPDNAIQGQASTGKILIYDGSSRVGANNWVLNKWVNYVFVHNGSAYLVYLNGVYLETITSGIVQVRYLGRSGNNSFSGLIDEVIIESRAWTAKEVETYYRKSMLNYKKNIFGAIVAFVLSVTKASVAITPKTIALGQALKVSKANVSITAKVVNLIFRGWRNITKNNAVVSNQSKNNASVSNVSKNDAVVSNINKS